VLAKEIVSERYVATPEVKDILTKRSKADELRYEQRTALDYATRFSRTTGKEATKLVQKLMKEVEGLKEHQAVLIVNLLPVDKDDLHLIFAKERIRLDDARIDTILQIANSAKLIDLAKIESELEKARLAAKEALEAEAEREKVAEEERAAAKQAEEPEKAAAKQAEEPEKAAAKQAEEPEKTKESK
jgi:DNA-directed RNA polymerase subunit F